MPVSHHPSLSADGQVVEVTLKDLVASVQGEYRTVEEKAAAVIRNAIVSGVFKPGERLPQDRLARLLDVSRMPIRSALRQLESEGLVELKAHKGATVRALSPAEIYDLYEMRILLETFALRKTVQAIADVQIAELEKLADELEGASDHEAWTAARLDFYRRLYSIGNTPRVVSTIMQFRAEVSRYTADLSDPRDQAHLGLLERIRLRDPNLAAAWLETHLRHVAQARRRQVANLLDRPVDDGEEVMRGSRSDAGSGMDRDEGA